MQKDKEIIDKVLQGERRAFGEIYDIYAAHLYRYISFRVSNTDDVEDILSNVFLRSFEALIAGKRVRHLRAFLYQATRNAIVDYFRQRARINEHETSINEEQEAIINADNAAGDAHIELSKVREGMKSLKREHQEVIQLRFIEELEIAEIAVALDKSHVAVRVLLHRALRSLKNKLNITS